MLAAGRGKHDLAAFPTGGRVLAGFFGQEAGGEMGDRGV